MAEIVVQPLRDLAALEQVEGLQRTIWGTPPDGIVPAHQLLATTSAGGAVLGAKTAQGVLVGFAYGFVGLREGRLLFYSHMTGVLRDFRDADVGFRLKCAQREFALAEGIDHMVWTFDPLVGANAYFNLHKLGALAQRYYVNYYGEMADDLNRGLPSDRVEVDWWLRSIRVESAIRGEHQSGHWEEAVPVLTARDNGPGLLPDPVRLGLDAPLLRVEMPLALDALKLENVDLARRWRTATREVFVHYLSRGYEAVDFLRVPSSKRRLGGYLFAQSKESRP